MATGRLLGNEATTTAALRFNAPLYSKPLGTGPTPKPHNRNLNLKKKKTIRRLTRSLSFSL